MQSEIPLLTIQGEATHDVLVLEVAEETVWLRIDQSFCGRDVEEEIDRSALLALTTGVPARNYDLLGLTFQTEGGELIFGTIGVGSGNQKFAVRRADLTAALT